MTETNQQTGGVGQRVAQARKLAGLTQRQLADRAAVSLSLVRSVEQGRVPATGGFLGAVSKALRVSVADLTGQPFPPAPGQDSEVHAAIAVIRTELAAYDLDNVEVSSPRPFAQLAADVQQVCQYRRNASTYKLGDALPPLLAEVRAAVHRSSGHDRDQALILLCELYYSAHSLAHKLGYVDLAARAIDRLAWAATESGSPLWTATSQFHRAAILTSGGDWSAALQFLEHCRSSIESRLSAGQRQDFIAWGGLHLQSGLAAARSGKRHLADAHLAEAAQIALQLGDDSDPILSFGPTNVGIWRVALAVEGMDGTEAPNRASTLVIPTGTPKERAGHHYIDLARAYLLHGNRAGAFDALQTAKTIAPSQTRYSPNVHETVRVLARAETRSTTSVHNFALWCGITNIL
ncbi:helix-turn-helix transcriptional regulator [Nocardia sp. NPDC051787]|uniref:helix-turn-helix domain-containing protein n=1 Tax=Nocardia sp. NPDC051787 TaxID=3155415 RepID=UPI003429A508